MDRANVGTGRKCKARQCEAPDAYHADHSALTSSMLKLFVGSLFNGQPSGGPRAYFESYIQEQPAPPRNPGILLTGNVFHTMCLEPHLLESRYRVIPTYAGASQRVAEAWKAEQPPGLTFVAADQWGLAERMAESLRQRCGELLDAPGYVELALQGCDSETEICYKARLDKLLLRTTGPVLLELKSTEDLEHFPQVASALNYPLQMAHYAAAIEDWLGLCPTVFFAVAERDPPHRAELFDMPPTRLRQALRLRRRALRSLHRCLTTGVWPAAFDQVPSDPQEDPSHESQ